MAQSLFLHVNDHLKNNDPIPETYFASHNRFVCRSCGKNFTTGRRHLCDLQKGSTRNTSISQQILVNSDQAPSSVPQDDRPTSPPSVSVADDFVYFRSISVLDRIPSGARAQVASGIAQLIDEVCRQNSVEAWCALFRFPAMCLSKSKRAGKNNQSLASVIKRRISTFLFDPLQTLPTATVSSEHRRSLSNAQKRAIITKKKIEAGDVRGAVRVISSDDSLSPSSEAVLESLQSKHPSTHPESNLPPAPSTSDIENSLTVCESQVLKTIHKFKPGSGGGPDLMKPQHLKDLMMKSTGVSSGHLLSSLTSLCNLMLRGNVPEDITPYLYGASLLALSKPDGGVRPIAVGSVYRRLACKIAAQVTSSSCGSHSLSHHQLGVGIPLGSETIIHATRAFCQNEDIEKQGNLLIKIDFSNAFNCIRRDVVLHQVREKAIFLFPFMWQMYGFESNLFFGNTIIKSAEGMQQGDPLGPYGFCLAINNLISNLSSPLNCWYLDDGCLGGPPSVIENDIDRIRSSQSALGLSLNISKCETIMADAALSSFNYPSLTPMKHRLRSEATILGSPIFKEGFEEVFTVKLSKLRTLSDRLVDLDSHLALTLLRNCFALPKVLHLLRSFPSFLFPELLDSFDGTLKASLEIFLNCSLSESSLCQALLPIGQGGLGLRSSMQLSIPAYLASAHGVEDRVSTLLPDRHPDRFLILAIQRWQEQCPNEPLPLNELKKSQREWDKPLTMRALRSLIDAADDKGKSRLLSVSSKGSSAWLSALPIPSLGLKLSNEQLRICVALRLGTRVCAPHRCICGALVQEDGTHGLSCRRNGGRASRHSEANDVIQRALASAGIPAIKEPQGMSRDDGKRPDGVTLIPWSRGRPLLWDFTCTDPTAQSNIAQALKGAGKVAEAAEERKRKKYAALSNDYIFCPVAAETFGALGPEASRFITEVGSRIRETTGERRATLFLRQRLSLAVQRGNAASVITCVPAAIPLREVLYFV